MLGVLVAVEGPSAAGKTTWCRAHAGRFVAEYSPAGREPDGVDLALQAGYWVETNSARLAAAAELERTEGVAVCDGDPLKLHYSWCLAAVGAAFLGSVRTGVRARPGCLPGEAIGFGRCGVRQSGAGGGA